MTKLLLIGESVGPGGGAPFGGASGRRLASLCGVSHEDFLSMVDAVNLLNRWPGRQRGPKGHAFPVVDARAAATALDLAGRTVALAGKRVALAFGLRDPPWLVEVSLGVGESAAFVVPHPSGVVRWYNDPDNGRAVGRLLRRLIKRCGRD